MASSRFLPVRLDRRKQGSSEIDGFRTGASIVNSTSASRRCLVPQRRILVAALVLALGFVVVWRAGPYSFHGHPWGTHQPHTDFTVYLAGAHAVLAGTDLYQAHGQDGFRYVYPLPLALVLAALTWMPKPLLVFLWYLLSIALVIKAISWAARLVGFPDGDRPGWAVLLPVVLTLQFLVDGLARGQATIPVVSLVIGAFYFDSRGKALRAGLCVAIAALIKVFPVVLLAYFAWRKRWKLCAATIALIVVGGLLFPAGVLGWQQTVDYLVEFLHVVMQPALGSHAQSVASPLYGQLLQWNGRHDQSLYAVTGRLISINAPALVPWVKSTSDALNLAMLVPIYWLGRRSRPDTEMFVICTVIVWLLLALPVTETHYYTLLLLPFFALTRVAVQATSCQASLARLLIGLFAIADLTVPLLGSRADILWKSGYLCWLCLLLWVGLLVLARRPPQTAFAAQSVDAEKLLD